MWLSRVRMGSCRIRLLFSLSAALPFSEEGHPVFNWRASVSCGHFLGVLFRYLSEGQGVEPLQAVAGAITGHDTTEGEDDDIEAPTVIFGVQTRRVLCVFLRANVRC